MQNDPFLKYAPSEDQLDNGMNTLHVAIRYRCSGTDLQEILTKKPELAKQLDVSQRTPMHQALVEAEYFLRVESLLALLNAYPDAAKIPDRQGTYLLHTAMAYIRTDYYSRVDVPGAPSHNGQIPLDLVLVRQANLLFIDRLLQIFPEAAKLPDGMNRPILHMVLDRRPQKYKPPGQAITRVTWQPKPIINEKACIELILRVDPSASSAVNPKNKRLPLHTAMADGTVPIAIIRLLLDACPWAVEAKDVNMEQPLHLGLRSLERVLHSDDDSEGFRNILEAITAVLNRNPEATASTRDCYGYTPLFRICKTLQAVHPYSKDASQVMKKIIKLTQKPRKFLALMQLVL
jgi:hypothetical protein